MRIYLIAPLPCFAADGEAAGTADRVIRAATPVVRVAAAAIATVAALIPAGFDIELCDEEITPIDLDTDADVVAITANVAQAQRAIRLAHEYRRRGKVVLMGGPHVSLAPELFAGAADCLVVGELEGIADQVFGDLAAGTLQPRYTGAKADMVLSPMPRWDLYPNAQAVSGVVQTSRGCPFECHFCDVIQYLGRKQRHKPADQVIAEIETLYGLGYRHISLSDDNFTAYRARTRALLTAIAAWNGAEGRDHVTFDTQMSIDVARDRDLLDLCVAAGLRQGFFGLETTSAEALTESRKRQNMRIDLVEECEKVAAAGIVPECGLIIGFDADGPDCFQRQLDFAMALPAVTFKVSVLVAPVATPLYASLEQAGRIVSSETASQFPGGAHMMTNFVPARMTREELAEGARWLFAEIMRPENVLVRFGNLARHLAPAPWSRNGAARRTTPRPVITAAYREVAFRASRDRGVRRLMEAVSALAASRPEIRDDLMDVLSHYLAVHDAMSREGAWVARSGTAAAA